MVGGDYYRTHQIASLVPKMEMPLRAKRELKTHQMLNQDLRTDPRKHRMVNQDLRTHLKANRDLNLDQAVNRDQEVNRHRKMDLNLNRDLRKKNVRMMNSIT